MYNSPGRREGSTRPADVRARRVPADLHEGSYRDFLRRHQRESADAARRAGRQRTEFAAGLFRRAADPRNLRCAMDYLALEGGGAPGPDGLTLDELDELGTLGARTGSRQFDQVRPVPPGAAVELHWMQPTYYAATGKPHRSIFAQN